MNQNTTKRNLTTITILIIIVAVLAIIAIIYGHNKKVPSNPADVIGNTAGNLNNKGYFCESDGVIYFANSNDFYKLYALDPSTFEAHLVADVPVAYINAAGDYLYFYYDDDGGSKFMGVSGNNHGIYRTKKKW